ncbi:unnamed protein product [Ophioblennius macclurei]
MAQWEAVLRLDAGLQSSVSRLYEGKLHRDVRGILSAWIESQDWDSAAADENTARTLFQTLLVYLEEQHNHSIENMILQGPNFSGMKHYLMGKFQNEPLKLALILSECLKEEKNILASDAKPQSSMDPNCMKLDARVNELKNLSAEVKKEIETLEDLHEKLDYIQKTWDSEVEQHQHQLSQSAAGLEQKCLERVDFIVRTQQIALEQVVNILKQTEQLLNKLTEEELPMWKRRQQLACIGSPENTDLCHLQKWFTSVAEVLLEARKHLQRLLKSSQRYNNADSSTFPTTMAQIDAFAVSLLTKLFTNALVVEKQPIMEKSDRCLILKTKVRFKVKLRFLVNLPGLKDQLTVKPVFDKDVKEVKTLHGFRKIEFTSNDSKPLDVDTEDRGLVVVFKNMSIWEKKSRIKGSSENRLVVTEELHVIKFVTTVKLNGLKCDVEASSLPVVVISSTSQAPSAWASILWWTMHSSSGPWNLSLFTAPPPLSWELLSQALSWQFLSVGKRGLDDNQLATLREKIVDHPEGLVDWKTFSKNENSWIWIDGILELIKTHLVDYWRDGSIMGFVSRRRTQALLLNKPSGTFLLRFSESIEEGAITFSWVHNSGGENNIYNVDPYTKSELKSSSLPTIIYHYSLMRGQKTRNPLLYLYPGIPKDAAFKRYYKPTKTLPGDGYVSKEFFPTSGDPTPPPSPPVMPVAMDTDIDMETENDCHQVIEELFSCLLDNQPLMSYQEPYQSSTLSPL